VTQSRPSILDRREVVALGGAATLALFAPAWTKSVESAGRARPAAPMVALADPRYRESLIFARSLQQEGAKVLALASDRARLWSDGIESRLPGLQYLTGLTLESDLFAFERLAESSSARRCYVGLHDGRCRQGSAHRLSGSIKLDSLAKALVSGKDPWAVKLGEALALAKEDSCEEGVLALDCVAPAAQGPRFFVSWLMRWAA
jgi:hypothetical protein